MTAPNPRFDIARLYRSFAAKLVVLAIVFLALPAILYLRFQDADLERNTLLGRAVEEQGRLIAEALRPQLERFAEAPPEILRAEVARLAGGDANVKLLLRPSSGDGTDGFFYVASAPPLSPEYLEQERATLLKTGVLGVLSETCSGASSLAVRYTNPAGEAEILTSLTPVHLPTGCWLVITSHRTAAFLRSSIAKPFWQTAEMQVALAIYILSAAIVGWLFSDIWKNVNLFRTAARRIRLRGADKASFRQINRMPELGGAAEDFDALVEALAGSQKFLREAAEENAHALKTPLAVIAQSMEPLKRAVDRDGDRAAKRSVELVERSVGRLDSLVSSMRDLEQATADLIFPRSQRMDLSAFLRKLLAAYEPTLKGRGLPLEARIESGVFVIADEDVLEPVIENLLENAASFAPVGGVIEASLRRAGGFAEIGIADRGSGVDPSYLDSIFQRYMSYRPRNSGFPSQPGDAHYGLGLWIARRNTESLGGSVIAANRDGGGFVVTVRLPLA